MRVIHHLHHPQDIFFIDDDPGKPEHTPCRVVRVDRHLNVILVADRHDLFKEVFQIGKQFFPVDILVHCKQFLHLCHPLRLPARHHRTVGIPCDRFKHLLRIKGIHCRLGIGKHR